LVQEDESTEEDRQSILDTIRSDQDAVRVLSGPESGITHAVPHLATDIKAVLKLAEGEKPALRIVRGKVVFTA